MKKIMKSLLIITIFVMGQIYACKQPLFPKHKTSDGLVPNQETAIKIAEAIWLPIYGNEIYSRKPFIATLKSDSIWVVQGTLNRGKGGVPYIEIQKNDCKILKVIHTK
jgi:hypothetical protein